MFVFGKKQNERKVDLAFQKLKIEKPTQDITHPSYPSERNTGDTSKSNDTKGDGKELPFCRGEEGKEREI